MAFWPDAAFPLSDHADYDELLRYVLLTGAKIIYTVHGFADAFAGDLRNLGFEAQIRQQLLSHGLGSVLALSREMPLRVPPL